MRFWGVFLGKIEKVREEDTFEDDEYFDRTMKKLKTEGDGCEKKEKNCENSEKTHYFASRKRDYEDLLQKQEQLNLKILDFEEKKETSQENEDEFEKFMQKNQESLDLLQKSKLLEELQRVNKELEE